MFFASAIDFDMSLSQMCINIRIRLAWRLRDIHTSTINKTFVLLCLHFIVVVMSYRIVVFTNIIDVVVQAVSLSKSSLSSSQTSRTRQTNITSSQVKTLHQFYCYSSVVVMTVVHCSVVVVVTLL